MTGCSLTPRNPRGAPSCSKPAVWLVTVRDAIGPEELIEHRCEEHRRIGRVVKERKL